MKGTLWLVPNALDLGAGPLPLDEVLPLAVIRRAATLAHWVVEDARSARAFLKRVHALVPLAQPLQSLHMRELPRPAKGKAAARVGLPAGPRATGGPLAPDGQPLLAPALAGHDLGLLSEAGLPAVADPGAALVAAAHAAGVPVQPLPGASALALALAASGLEGQQFAFVGYLPQEAVARAARLRELEARSRQLQQTQICIETPYRNAALLGAMLAVFGPGTRLAISCGLTLPGGWSRMQTVSAWRRAPPELPERTPAVFAWQA